MKQDKKYPPGWDEERVRRVIAHYEQQSEEEAVAEDETLAVVGIPKELVPEVRQIIAKYEKKKAST